MDDLGCAVNHVRSCHCFRFLILFFRPLLGYLKDSNAAAHSVDSGAPEARRAAKRSPIFIWERKGNPSMNFLMVIMASGIARGRVRTTTTTATTATESRKMAAIIQINICYLPRGRSVWEKNCARGLEYDPRP